MIVAVMTSIDRLHGIREDCSSVCSIHLHTTAPHYSTYLPASSSAWATVLSIQLYFKICMVERLRFRVLYAMCTAVPRAKIREFQRTMATHRPSLFFLLWRSTSNKTANGSTLNFVVGWFS